MKYVCAERINDVIGLDDICMVWHVHQHPLLIWLIHQSMDITRYNTWLYFIQMTLKEPACCSFGEWFEFHAPQKVLSLLIWQRKCHWLELRLKVHCWGEKKYQNVILSFREAVTIFTRLHVLFRVAKFPHLLLLFFDEVTYDIALFKVTKCHSWITVWISRWNIIKPYGKLLPHFK